MAKKACGGAILMRSIAPILAAPIALMHIYSVSDSENPRQRSHARSLNTHVTKGFV